MTVFETFLNLHCEGDFLTTDGILVPKESIKRLKDGCYYCSFKGITKIVDETGSPVFTHFKPSDSKELCYIRPLQKKEEREKEERKQEVEVAVYDKYTSEEIRKAIINVLGIVSKDNSPIILYKKDIEKIVNSMPSVVGEYPVLHVSKEDIEEAGYKASSLSDLKMREFAYNLGIEILDLDFYHNYIGNICEKFNLPKLKNK